MVHFRQEASNTGGFLYFYSSYLFQSANFAIQIYFYD